MTKTRDLPSNDYSIITPIYESIIDTQRQRLEEVRQLLAELSPAR